MFGQGSGKGERRENESVMEQVMKLFGSSSEVFRAQAKRVKGGNEPGLGIGGSKSPLEEWGK